MAQVIVSVQLLSVDIASNGQITAYFSDSPQIGHVYESLTTLEDYLSHKELWLPTLRAMALLDYTQESVVGKTVTMSCADPDDLWVKAI